MGFLHQSQRVFTPLSQQRLENTTVVRLRKGGCRFEVACIKNTVANWRSGVETDLEQVLQSRAIFENVSRAKRAHDEDIERVFKTLDIEHVAKIIIETGEVQVTDEERATHNESVFREIAGIVADRCVHPESNRPYSVSSIEKLMKDTQYALNPNRSVKQQASDVVQSLKARIPITRAKMKVQVSVGLQDESLLNDFLSSNTANIVEQQSSDAGLSYVCLIEPDVYRSIDTFVAQDAASRSFVVVERYFHEGSELVLESEDVKPAPVATNETPAQPPAIPVAAPKPRGRACGTCGGNFADSAQYRDHFRSEWHRYNLKMKAKGSAVTDERSFLALDAAAIQSVFESLE
ncbi:unnamed protein product [Aphanomyces euteiches]|uniref:C2H2-type domain-containing protein n=1 Tax=Aphanomyces euteiches TaxID=100861 RepID=A0A6G0WVV7_9STRA|nr:hypothetical protein Ae201684_010996 [Aphanomyces euteiches]KAH9156280.1 hypothetical protein AeRB84_001819 [Aphanomyces euteiches]